MSLQEISGVIMLLLLMILVFVKRIATGSTIDVPGGSLPVRLINAFNLFFLLIVLPGISFLLITGHMETADPTRINLPDPWAPPVLDLAGLLIYTGGHVLMCRALICLGHHYQTGGMPPRSEDVIISHGPFRVIRHPIYAAALCISLGLAVMTQSGTLFILFVVYFMLIIILINIEEGELVRTHAGHYLHYRRNVRKLIPFFY